MSNSPKPPKTPGPTHDTTRRFLQDPSVLAKRHLRFGWWTLLIFLTLGLGLEALHGFKVGMYLSGSSETRRLMWTLAHAHGTLLGLVNLAFAFTIRLLPEWAARERGFASLCFRGSTWLLPSGFFLGGIFIHGGDPGLGILLVPIGGLLLLAGAYLAACGTATLRTDMSSRR
jgi:hypothetical protein